jgi:hypothetical protein
MFALNGLGEAAQSVDALRHHTAALTVASDTSGRRQQARAHAGLGRAYRALGDPGQARAEYEHALYTDLGSPEADRSAPTSPPHEPDRPDHADDRQQREGGQSAGLDIYSRQIRNGGR